MESTRKDERHELFQPVQARCETWGQFLSLHTRNISQGGIFLAVDDPPAVDTRIELRFDLPNGQTLLLHARVAHVVTAERADADDLTAGFGLEFDALTLDEEAFIDHLVELAKKHVAAPPPPLPSKG